MKKYTCSSGKNYADGGKVEAQKPVKSSSGTTAMGGKNFGVGKEAKPKGKC